MSYQIDGRFQRFDLYLHRFGFVSAFIHGYQTDNLLVRGGVSFQKDRVPESRRKRFPAHPVGQGINRFYSKEVFVSGKRSEEHTSELQSRENLVCRLLLEKKKETH